MAIEHNPLKHRKLKRRNKILSYEEIYLKNYNKFNSLIMTFLILAIGSIISFFYCDNIIFLFSALINGIIIYLIQRGKGDYRSQTYETENPRILTFKEVLKFII